MLEGGEARYSYLKIYIVRNFIILRSVYVHLDI